MSENPYQSPDGKADATKSPLAFLGGLVACGAIFVLVVALLLPAHRGAREPARRNQCFNNLKQTSLSLLSYIERNGSLPPAYTEDAQDNRLHSWRTLILEYGEGNQQLIKQIDLSKPWDDPTNSEARETEMDLYTCPSAPFDYGQTTYFAVVGPESAFAAREGRKVEVIVDGTANTAWLVEGPHESAVHWMSPTDVNIDRVLAFGPDKPTGHPGGFVAAFVDGHVAFIDEDVDRDVLRAMLTAAGGDELAD